MLVNASFALGLYNLKENSTFCVTHAGHLHREYNNISLTINNDYDNFKRKEKEIICHFTSKIKDLCIKRQKRALESGLLEDKEQFDFVQ